MLVAFGASIARDAGDTVFTGTLARGLVTGLAGGAHGMAIALCGGNTQQEGQGERGAGPGGVAALAGSRASAAALPAALVARLHRLRSWRWTSGQRPVQPATTLT